MSYRVKLSDLAHMPVVDSDRVLGELVRSAKTKRNGQAAVLDARIREFEMRYELTSDELRERLRTGTIEETAEIARWLFTLDARDNRRAGK